MPSRRQLVVTILLMALLPAAVYAAPVAYPPDRTALTLITRDGSRLSFSLADLQRLPQRTLKMSDAQGKVQQWIGVPLDELLTLTAADAADRPLRVAALNHYSVIIPAEDIRRYRPLVAYLRDGHYLSILDYGPLQLLYPFDDYPELHKQSFYNRTVWQLSEIYVE